MPCLIAVVYISYHIIQDIMVHLSVLLILDSQMLSSGNIFCYIIILHSLAS